MLDYESRGLCPKIWDNGKLRPEVREQTLKAAKYFIDEYKIPMVSVDDITLTGSLAGFYWSPTSDMDVHIVADFTKIGDDPYIMRYYYDLAKIVWGNNRPQNICGHEVEVYVQDLDQPLHASGVYSIYNDRWIEIPEKKGDVKIDQKYIDYKISFLEKRLGHAERLVAHDPDKAMSYIDALKDKIHAMRKKGLEEAGEMSPDNLAYKEMRRRGLVKRIRDLYKMAYSRDTSLEC